MAISWESIRGLVIFFGPIILPKAIAYYRSVRSASNHHGLVVQPVPPRVRFALSLLLVVCVVYLLKTLPFFDVENIITRTDSRVQTPSDVVFNRLAALRPGGNLTPGDEALRAKFVNLESRLLYLQFGPDVVAGCRFCTADEPKSYFYYAFPALAWPHLANVLAIAVATSPSLTGKYGAQWRVPATIAATVVAFLEIYLVNNYDHHGNARARASELDFFFWTMRRYRLAALAALDALLGWVLWLSATNRAFVQVPSPAERVENVNRALDSVKSKMNAVGIVKNTTQRDEALRNRSQTYWTHEGTLMGSVMEEREVVESVNDALSKRIDIQAITRDAENYAENVLLPLKQTENQVSG